MSKIIILAEKIIDSYVLHQFCKIISNLSFHITQNIIAKIMNSIILNILKTAFRTYGFHFSLLLFFLAFSAGFIRAQTKGIFEEDDVLMITISGDLVDLLNDRTGTPEYRPATLSYSDETASAVAIPIKVRTRGNFRRRKDVCSYPPLLLNFSKKNSKQTIFHDQDKLKLVMPCKGDKYVVQEYFTYKLYNLVTEKSFRTRLVQVVLRDPNIKEKKSGPFYGILLEEEDQMAKRNNMISVDRTLVRPDQTELEDFLNMAVFEYLIGNTDWSVQYRQNVKLMAADSLSKPSTVPYDFDHAGIVGAPYAKPAEELLLSNTKNRRYRGFCITDMAHFDHVIAHYNQLKDKIYALYTGHSRLEERYTKSTLKYLDEFYKTINNPKKLKNEFQYPCLESGTGHIIIKGLNN